MFIQKKWPFMNITVLSMGWIGLLTFSLCTCTEESIPENTINLLFEDGTGEYAVGTLWEFNSLQVMVRIFAQNGISSSISVPGTSKAVLDTIINLIQVAPTDMPDLNNDALYHLLGISSCLGIVKEEKKRLFFKNIALKSLHGQHAANILAGNYSHVCANHTATDLGTNVYVGIFKGFLDALDLDVRVFADTATICTREPTCTQYGDAGYMFLGDGIRRVRIQKCAEAFLRHETAWVALKWLFQHLRVHSLNVSTCSLCDEDIARIAETQLVELDISGCGITEGGLRCLTGDYMLRHSLYKLNASANKLSLCDIAAIAMFTQLADLDVSSCYLGVGDLFPLRHGGSTFRTLVRLKVSFNKVGVEDLVAITGMVLTELIMRSVGLEEGWVALMLENSNAFLRANLRKVDFSQNPLGENDIAAISGLLLREISISGCSTKPGWLYPLTGIVSIARYALERMDISDNKLGYSDLAAISTLMLKELIANNCGLGGFCNVLFGRASVLRKNITTLAAKSNDLGRVDIVIISHLQLTDLNISDNRLLSGWILHLSKATKLKGTLCKLDVSCNMLDAMDVEALKGFSVTDANLSRCCIPRGGLSTLAVGSSSLKKTLKRLDISYNALGPEDMSGVFGLQIQELDVTECDISLESFLELWDNKSDIRKTMKILHMSKEYLLASESATDDGAL